MLVIIAIVLLVIWGFGFFAFHIASGFIHTLIAFAALMFILHFVTGRRRPTT